MDIKDNILRILGGLPLNVKLVAVSKTHPMEAIKEAYDAGQRVFGENKPQEMKAKSELLPSDIQWHMIGHLQTNKVRMIMPFVSMIDAVDSIRLLELINSEAERIDRTVDLLLEVHIAQEESKHGWNADDLALYIESGEWRNLNNVRICGLMSVATYTDDMAVVSSEFETLKRLFDRLAPQIGESFSELSIGMSHDYHIAIKHGATMVRIGSDIFGNRDYSI